MTVEVTITPLTEARRWWIAIAVMLVTVMEVLDMTIVNVALPTIRGALGATTEQISWVLTSYVVSAAIVMPLSGFLIQRLGAKRLLLINIVGFLIASMLCGMATSLTMMVVFRIFQGIFGATLVPLSQFILRYTFTPAQMTKAMAIWGIGIMSGPVAGPTLGGYITDHLSWRWLFYINLPVCLVALSLCWRLITETVRQKNAIDWLGMALLGIGVGTLQVFLDRGNTVNWFADPSIRWLSTAFIFAVGIFIYRGLPIPYNIINLKLFYHRNFSLGCLLIALFCASLMGTITLQPIFMENLLHYPTAFAGLVMAPRGLASAVGMALVPLLIKRIDARYILLIGIVLSGLGTYALTRLNLNISDGFLMWTGALQGLGMGLFFVPLSTLTFVRLSPTEYAEASGLFSFWRSLGTSIGISTLITVLTRENQINGSQLNAHIQPFNPNLHYWLSIQHIYLMAPNTLALLSGQIAQQASLLSFLTTFHVVMLNYWLMIPLIFFLQNPQKSLIT